MATSDERDEAGSIYLEMDENRTYTLWVGDRPFRYSQPMSLTPALDVADRLLWRSFGLKVTWVWNTELGRSEATVVDHLIGAVDQAGGVLP